MASESSSANPVTSSDHVLEEVVDSRTEEATMTDVVVAQIDPRLASDILQKYAIALPLQQYNLGHMKRVRRDLTDPGVLEVLVCPTRCYADVAAELKQMCKPATRVVAVPRLQPLTRAEYEEWGKNWPTLFRPNAVVKEREKGHTTEEVALHARYMALALLDGELAAAEWANLGPPTTHAGLPSSLTSSSWQSPLRGGAVVVNPENGRVITMSHAAMRFLCASKGPGVLRNPLMDETMLCIEAVAAAVRGDGDAALPCCCGVAAPPAATTSTISGSSFKTSRTAHTSSSAAADDDDDDDDDDNDNETAICQCHERGLPEDQYLCTGLDLYVAHEPDLMIGMALVHSRIRRVYYCHPCPRLGALGTRHHIHSLRALNHRYRVYRIRPIT